MYVSAPGDPSPPSTSNFIPEFPRFLSLDVRACNLPAIALYTKLGFKKAQKSYPPFYDWHGGYSMTASAVDVAKKMPTGFDTSALE